MRFSYIVIAALAVTVTVLILLALCNNKKKTQNCNQYLQLLLQLYNEKNIVDSLGEIKKYFKRGSAEYIAIDKAIFYLGNSIMKDYETAFVIIEKVFHAEEIKELHRKIIEQEKANVVFLLK